MFCCGTVLASLSVEGQQGCCWGAAPSPFLHGAQALLSLSLDPALSPALVPSDPCVIWQAGSEGRVGPEGAERSQSCPAAAPLGAFDLALLLQPAGHAEPCGEPQGDANSSVLRGNAMKSFFLGPS